jgi:heptose I phosphotransferase
MDELYLRNDLKVAWNEREPFKVVRDLQGETYRSVKNRRTIRFVENKTTYFAKIHDGVGWGELIKNLICLKPPVIGARNEYLACRHLEAQQIPAPRVAGFGRYGRNPARIRSFVICDALEGFISLEDFTNNWHERPPSLRLRWRLVDAVADLTRDIHRAGVNHRDYYLCHIFADVAALEREEIELAVIDLHRAQVRSHIPRKWVLRDLAALLFSVMHLGLSRTDYLRFIARYTGRPFREALKQDDDFWHKVDRRARRLFAKAVSRGIV